MVDLAITLLDLIIEAIILYSCNDFAPCFAANKIQSDPIKSYDVNKDKKTHHILSNAMISFRGAIGTVRARVYSADGQGSRNRRVHFTLHPHSLSTKDSMGALHDARE